MSDKTAEVSQHRTFEDFKAGQVFDLGERLVAKDDIIAFAALYDPQPFHLDEEAGRQSILGGLSASGWHTCSLMMRMFYDGVVKHSSSMGAPGVDRVSWLQPVKAGDTIRGSIEVLNTRPSKSRPQMGFVHFSMKAENQSGVPVYEQSFSVMFGKREAG